ncbi:MAG: hypothetical protein WKF84_12790 [Pyrinomonadaceae bacterium]
MNSKHKALFCTLVAAILPVFFALTPQAMAQNDRSASAAASVKSWAQQGVAANNNSPGIKLHYCTRARCAASRRLLVGENGGE